MNKEQLHLKIDSEIKNYTKAIKMWKENIENLKDSSMPATIQLDKSRIAMCESFIYTLQELRI